VRRASATGALLAALVALAVAAGSAGGATRATSATPLPATPPAKIVALLNAQRAAHGIPAGIRHVPDWSRKCLLHNTWMQRNNRIQHPEEPGTPGYSVDGNWAGTNSVLASGTDWADGNPWETAPIHLIQMLGPGLARMGASEAKGYDCATTWPGYERVGAKDVVYTYPGDGTVGWRPSEIARESPFTPGEKIGIPEGTRTGPYLYILPDGPWTKRGTIAVTAAKLTGPGGAAHRVRVIDKRNPDVGPFMPAGSAMLIPVRPLQGGARYTATVTLRGEGGTQVKTWSFTTARDNAVTQKVEVVSGSAFRVIASSTAPDPKVTVDGKAAPVTQDGTAWATGPLPVRPSFEVCVRSGGGSSGYVAATSCSTWRFS
jgi:hypothetical protein